MMKPCPECDGSGYVTVEIERPMSFSNPYGFIDEEEEECSNCDGSGEIEDEDYEDERGDWLLHKMRDDE